MAGKSPVAAGEEQRKALRRLASSRERGEADRARAILLTLPGWTSPRIAEAFGVGEDTVRLWRMDFARDGVAALQASVAPGPPPVKSQAALRVVTPLLEAPVADRSNWTIARLRVEIEAREGIKIDRSRLSKTLRFVGGYQDHPESAPAKAGVLLGHSSLSTTARYTHVATTTIAATQSPFDRLNLEAMPPM